MASRSGRSSEEDALLQKALRLLPGGVLGGYYAPQELAFIVREARGARLYDHSGHEYIDYILGSGPLVLGHAHPRVIAAVEGQLRKGTTYFQLSEPTVALADEICRAVPCAEQIRFCSTFTHALIRRGVVKAAQKFDVSLAHGEEDIDRTLHAFDGALEAAASRRD